jgi:predicted CXXCH cytochrome family protein
MTIKVPRNVIWGGLLVGLGLVLLAGCGTPRERYRVLSYFFDGVPDPDAVKRVTNAGGVQVPVLARTVIQHKPYADNQCDVCHRSARGEIQEFSEAYKQCVKCHKTVSNERVLMHGPVAREECRWCHAPHESAEPALLKDTPVKVCVQCHDKELLGPNPPEHLDGTTSCLDCHYGHGGDGRYFLKPPPTSQPAPASAPGAGSSEAQQTGKSVGKSTGECTPLGRFMPHWNDKAFSEDPTAESVQGPRVTSPKGVWA